LIKKIKISDYIAIGAILISISSIVYTCCQDKKLNNLTYHINSIEHRPHLKIVDISINNCTFKSRPFTIFKETENDSDTLNIEVNIEVETTLKIVNIGNSKASLILEVAADTASGNMFLKNVLPRLTQQAEKSEYRRYYPYFEINVNDTAIFTYKRKIENIDDNKFTLHFYLLYNNELQQFFDTYYWARFSVTPFLIQPQFNNNIKNNSLPIIYNFKDIERSIHFVDDNNFSYTYSEKEKKKMGRLLNKLDQN
jgi:hypothetical protein